MGSRQETSRRRAAEARANPGACRATRHLGKKTAGQRRVSQIFEQTPAETAQRADPISGNVNMTRCSRTFLFRAGVTGKPAPSAVLTSFATCFDVNVERSAVFSGRRSKLLMSALPSPRSGLQKYAQNSTKLETRSLWKRRHRNCNKVKSESALSAPWSGTLTLYQRLACVRGP